MKKVKNLIVALGTMIVLSIGGASARSVTVASMNIDGYQASCTFEGTKSYIKAETFYDYVSSSRTATAYGYYYDINGNNRTISNGNGSGSQKKVSITVNAPSSRNFYSGKSQHTIYGRNGGRFSTDSGNLNV